MTDETTERQNFLADAISGFTASPKWLPCKYFYDERGSLLFEKICKLDEYYLTRCELELMQSHIDAILGTISTRCRLVELGSGSSLKTNLILERLQSPSVYVPVDISAEMLMQTAERFHKKYPQMQIQPVCADFTQRFDLPPLEEQISTVVYFPGSTIGNFNREQSVVLFRQIRELVGDSGGLLIGYDLQKDRSILESAYDDSQGVTARFNLNLLKRMNRELGADFELSQFEHRAIYNEDEGRIEMHLISLCEQNVLLGDRQIRFQRDEAIHTENSYKYSVQEFSNLAAEAGLQSKEIWYDAKRYFVVQYLTSQS